MITYLSTEGHDIIHSITDFDEMKAKVAEVLRECKIHYKGWIAFDTETTGLDPLIDVPLLIGIGHGLDQLCIDCRTVNFIDLLPDDIDEYMWLAHNAKFDLAIIASHYGKLFKRSYCTLVADQRIYQNAGFEHNIYAVRKRHLDISNTATIETESFIGANPETFKPTYSQLAYLADDIEYLHAIKDSQVKMLNQYNMTSYMAHVEFPLTRVLVKMELEGVDLHNQRWTENTFESEKHLHDIQCKLDAKLHEIRDTLPPHRRQLLIGDIYTAKRNFRPAYAQGDIFSGITYKTPPASKGNINWNSDKQVLDIFWRLGYNHPTKDGKGLVPIMMTNDEGKQFIVNKVGYNADGESVAHDGWSTSSKVVDKYVIEHPDDPACVILDLISQHGKALKSVSTYGHSFLAKKNPTTNRIHTVYRQTSTANCRLSSGGGQKLKQKPNLQNIPRDVKYRHCFIARPGHMIQTVDLTGAEVVIICDKANDDKLYELAVVKDDAHSPIITNSWRHIYLYRGGMTCGAWDEEITVDGKKKTRSTADVYKDRWKVHADIGFPEGGKEADEFHKLFKEFTVSKKQNKPYRQGGKNCTFGSIYNMKAKTAAATYNGTTKELRAIDPNAQPVNVTEDEAKVALWAIRQFIPKTFKYTDEASKFAFANGYLILNERANTRAWFKPVIDIKAACDMLIEEMKEDYGIEAELDRIWNGNYYMSTGDKYELDWQDVKEIDGQARNLPISGTQADMLKEAMVVIDNFIEEHDLPLTLLMQVHDELVYEIPENYKDIKLPLMVCERTGIYWDPERPFEEFVPYVMTEIANLYLNNVTMKADYDIEPYWTK